MGKHIRKREGAAQPETFPLTGWPVNPYELDLSQKLRFESSPFKWHLERFAWL